ncbi:MAG: hypothetical protein DRQ55_01660 [Planctomycetota bacterium]|nr:MAG: hypothetical protein DRQ55_01660 [Planctomycetota bacterium]
MLAALMLAALLCLTAPEGAQLLFEVRGHAPGDGFGLAVARVPDRDADGVDELAVGAPARGRVRIISGATGELQETLRGAVGFGAVLQVRDIDGDGRSELLAGPLADDPERYRVLTAADGRSLPPARRMDPGRVLADPGRPIPGQRVLPLGDLDGDGLADWASTGPLGAASHPIELRSGRDGALLHVLRSESADQGYGWSVADAGDVDGDGFDDVIVGAPGDDVAGRDAGAAWIHSGRSGEPLITLYGRAEGERLGSLVGSLGDVDGDGLDDVWVTAFEGTVDGPGVGVVRVYRVLSRLES